MIRATRTLLRLSLRGIAAHRARLVLTTLSVVLSTAFIAATVLLSGALGDTVTRLTSSGYRHADIIIRPADGHRSLPEGIEHRVLSGHRIDRAEIDDRRSVVLSRGAAPDAPTVDTGGMPVHPGPWYGPARALDPDTRLVAGAPPDRGETVVTEATADTASLDIGDEVTVTGDAAEVTLTVSGISTGGDTGGLGLGMDGDDYRGAFAAEGLPGLAVRTAPGASPEDVAAALADDLARAPGGSAVSVRTAEEVEASDAGVLRTGVGYLRYILGMFGAVALVVGMFLVANTFAMTVGQRMRDYALLRALGMSGRQVTASVLCEAVAVGALGSTVGVAAGAGLVAAAGATAADTPLAPDVPLGNVGLLATTVLVPWVVGTATTVLAAWAPARRAASVAPAEAAGAGLSTASTAPSRVRTLAGTLTCAVGVLLVGIAVGPGSAWDTRPRVVLCGAGTIVALVGVHLVSAAVVRLLLPPLGRILSLPLGRSFRVPAAVAVRTVRRTPRRTAATAYALTLGMCLVTVTGMAGASTEASLRQAVDTEVTADLVVAAPGGAVDVAVPGATVGRVRDAPGVGATFTLGKALAVIGEAPTRGLPLVTVSNADPSTVLDVGTTHGNLDIGTGDGITMSSSYAAEHGWSIGDMVPVAAQGQDRAVELRLTGTYGHSRILGDVVIGASAFWRLAPGTQGGTGHRVVALLVDGDGTLPRQSLADRLTGLLGDGADVTVQTPTEYAGEQSVLVERIIVVVYALLALAVVVAVLGVVNTLALSVVERRREIGMLRAVGTSRGHVRRMVALEAVLTTVYGAVLGTGVGLGAGWALLTVLTDVGLTSVAVPWTLVITVLAVSVPVGAVAALAPAARAARIPPLEAVQP
ncbi:ABC transporter permease [Corynebacterium sp. USCH3]|uniref:ABC transporter permease n=1 Tax=Corynebacterium sp. USCH3 TaxID=3024840 RepID=UPI0030B0539C